MCVLHFPVPPRIGMHSIFDATKSMDLLWFHDR